MLSCWSQDVLGVLDYLQIIEGLVRIKIAALKSDDSLQAAICWRILAQFIIMKTSGNIFDARARIIISALD
jgi:hypothetical protein